TARPRRARPGGPVASRRAPSGGTAMNAEPLLDVRGLTKSFGGFTAVAEVDLAGWPGTIHPGIGPNGGGQTPPFPGLTRAPRTPPGGPGHVPVRRPRLARRPPAPRHPPRPDPVVPDHEPLPAADRTRVGAGRGPGPAPAHLGLLHRPPGRNGQ